MTTKSKTEVKTFAERRQINDALSAKSLPRAASEAKEEATILNRINKKTLELFIGVNFVGYVVQQGESLYTS